MSGIFQGDVVIKTMIELGIDDMRKNPWLINHMLGDFTAVKYFTDKYGQKQVDACKEWFANNEIAILLRGREDQDKYPCVSIRLAPSNENPDMKTMADQSTETTILMPNEIGKPIPFVVKPFTPVGYDNDSGELEVPDDLKGFDAISAGMVLVNPQTGEGYVIEDIMGDSIMIQPGLNVKASQLAVVPQYQYYQARIEHTFFNETYVIGCHAHGDVNQLLWLHSIVMYALLRYRESLLEANGFTQSVVGSGDLDDDGNFTGPGGEKVYTRQITLTGQVEQSWIKSPQRYLESIVLKDPDPPAGTNASKGYTGGIKIISNLNTPDFVDQSDETWTTIED